MFGLSLSEEKPSIYVYCEKKSFVKNYSSVYSTLNKKHFVILFSFGICNASAVICTNECIPTGGDLADAIT